MTRKLKLGILLSAGVIAYSQEKPSPNFTGGEVKAVKENSQGATVHFYFGLGARTKWHSHEGGQIILVEDGVGLYQEKADPLSSCAPVKRTTARPEWCIGMARRHIMAARNLT